MLVDGRRVTEKWPLGSRPHAAGSGLYHSMPLPGSSGQASMTRETGGETSSNAVEAVRSDNSQVSDCSLRWDDKRLLPGRQERALMGDLSLAGGMVGAREVQLPGAGTFFRGTDGSQLGRLFSKLSAKWLSLIPGQIFQCVPSGNAICGEIHD
jgi:hypothetical protein